MSKKVFLKTFGCQMNARDSEFVTGLLIDNGFKLANSIDRADLVAWNKEIDNRRDRFVREVRKRAMEEPFRKNL